MKNQIVFLLLFISPIFSVSQENGLAGFNVEFSETYEYIRSYTNIYSHLNDNLLCIKSKSNDLMIQKLTSSTLDFNSVKRYNDQREYGRIEHVGVLDNTMYLYYSIWDKKNEKEQIYYREIDTDKGCLTGKDIPMFKVNGKIVGQMEGVSSMYDVQNIGKFKFDYSKDSSKLMIFYRKISEERNDAHNYDKIGFHIYDQNMDPLWYKEVLMPYTEKRMDIIDYLIDTKGNAYILAYVFSKNSSRKELENGKPNFRVEIMKITPDNPDIEIFPVTIENQLISFIRFKEGNNNEIIGAGFFSYTYKTFKTEMARIGSGGKNEHNLDAKGIFSFTLDELGEVYNNVVYNFSLNMLNQNESKTQQRNNKKYGNKTELEHLYLDRIIIEEDGSIIIIGEQVYQVTKGTKMISTFYYYDDIIVGKISNKGELEWIKKLPKKQVGKDTGIADMSFKHFYSNGIHYFFYLDNAKNISLIENQEPKSHKAKQGGLLTAYTVISSDGKIYKTPILDLRNTNEMSISGFSPNQLFKISPNEYIFEVNDRKKEGIIIKLTANK